MDNSLSQQNEIRQLLKLLKSLEELRRVRARSLESTHGLNPSSKDIEYFHNVISINESKHACFYNANNLSFICMNRSLANHFGK